MIDPRTETEALRREVPGIGVVGDGTQVPGLPPIWRTEEASIHETAKPLWPPIFKNGMDNLTMAAHKDLSLLCPTYSLQQPSRQAGAGVVISPYFAG